MEQLPFRHFELDAQPLLLYAAPHTKERGIWPGEKPIAPWTSEEVREDGWLCRTGIDAKYFPFIRSVLTYLATASLYRWCPYADVNCVIVLRASH